MPMNTAVLALIARVLAYESGYLAKLTGTLAK